MRRPTVDGNRRGTQTRVRNEARGDGRYDGRRDDFFRDSVVNSRNPRDWNNWSRTWNNYGVAPYQRNWYRGTWGGFAGPGFYTPFGFGYGGYNGYGYGGLGGLGFGLGNFGYGLNPWLMNSMGYRWGYYGGFYNPYYVADYAWPYNYAQPVYLTYYSQQVEPPVEVVGDFEAARRAFRQEQYDDALVSLDRVLEETPSDTTAHEFRALTLFALGRYAESAGTLNSLLAVAPGWSWATMSGLYADVEVYTGQLRALEVSVRDEPDLAASRFVLGYHYLVAGHQDAARRQFARVVELEPKDRVAQQLLTGLERADEPRAAALPEPREDDRYREGVETDLVGHWTARRDKDMPFDLTLRENGEFTWIAGEGDKASEVSGTYELKDQTLVLDGGKNESLVGYLAAEGEDRFHFKLLGSPAEDPGLEFERAER